MAVEVETLLVKLEARITDFEKKMNAAERKATSTAKKIQGSFSGLSGVISKSFAALGVGLSAGALLKIVKDGIAAGEAIGDLSEKLGLTAEQLQQLTFIAQQNGAGVEDIEAGFRGMTKFLGDASKGTDKAINLLHQLGLTFDELRTKSPNDVFETLLDRIGKIGNPLQRNATLIQVFGKAGTQLAQIASLGANGMEELRKEAERLGVVMSNQTVKNLQAAGDQLDILQGIVTKAEGVLAEKFVPVLRDLIGLLSSPQVQQGIDEMATSIASFIESTITDVKNLIAIAEKVRAEFPGGNPTGGLSANDQPVPPGVRGNSDAADQFIASGGLRRLQQRFDDTFSATAGSGKLTTEMVKAAAAAKANAAAAKGMTDAYETLGGVTDDAAAAQKKAEAAAEAAAKKYLEESKQLQLLGEQAGRSERDQFIFNEVNQAGADISTDAGQAIAQQAAHVYDLQQAYKRTVEQVDLFRDSAREGLSTFVSDLRQGKSVLESLGDALDRITDKLVDFALNQAVNALLGSSGLGGGLLTGRASGGSVSRGQPVVVGENGPEIFVPRTGGIIGHGRGGGVTVETHYHNNANVRVQEKQSKTESGVRLDVMIDDVVSAKGLDPSSKISRMLTSRGAGTSIIRR